ncbi:hypothetical protein ACLOJK_030393 [Asimina triloba]
MELSSSFEQGSHYHERISKLKEHNERNIEIENETFDRYMQNVSLLEEAFYVDPLSEITTDYSSAGAEASTSGEDETSKMVATMKARSKSNVKRAEGFRKIVNDLLKKLRKVRCVDELKSCLETKLPLLDHNYMGQADSHEDKDAKTADGQWKKYANWQSSVRSPTDNETRLENKRASPSCVAKTFALSKGTQVIQV